MNIIELIQITGGQLIKSSEKKEFNKIKIDSRDIKENDIFLTVNTGYKYIKDAIKNGASLIITDSEVNVKESVSVIKINDSINTLYKLAAYIRNKYNPIVVAITGSVGKTTTKEMIYELLKYDYNVIKNDGNENNHIGVPKTLLKIDSMTEIVITEIGMNHEGEIEFLSKLVKPDVAVITNIGTSHIGNLGTIKNIFKEKMNITKGMKSGILILNQDDKYLKKVDYLENINIYKVGISKNSNIVVYNLKKKREVSTEIYIENKLYNIHVISVPFLINYLLALQTALLFNINADKAIDTLNNYKSTNNRLEIITLENTTIYSDCYNASLESFINVLDIIKQEKKNKVLILGDILELGKYSKKIHKEIGKKIRGIKKCQIIIVGKYVKYIKKYNQTRCIWCSNNEEIKECLSILDLTNKIILIKGSHGMHLDEITKYIKENK